MKLEQVWKILGENCEIFHNSEQMLTNTVNAMQSFARIIPFVIRIYTVNVRY